jgi:hypothetical protein
LLVHLHAAVGGGAEREIEHEGQFRASGNSDTDRIEPSLSIPPQGAMVGSALVIAIPIMSASIAMRT